MRARGRSGWLSDGRRCEGACGSRLDKLGCGTVLEGWGLGSAIRLDFHPVLNLASSWGFSATARGSLGPTWPDQPKAWGPGLLEAIVFLYPFVEVRTPQP